MKFRICVVFVKLLLIIEWFLIIIIWIEWRGKKGGDDDEL